MTTIGMQYDVIPGKEREFEDGFTNVIGVLKSAGGHVASRLFQDVASPGSYMIWSCWERQADFTAFIRSDAFKQVTAWGRAEILKDRPKHTVYQDDAGAMPSR